MSGLKMNNARLTPLGGLAVKLRADEALSEGEIVTFYQTGGALDVRKAPTAGDMLSMPIGAVYADAADQADVWVVVAGIAYVLPESGITAAIGDVAFTSASEAGRADQDASVPTTEHWREIGHWAENGAGNGLKARMVLHFN